jgi:hypothetical protein
MNEKLEIQVNEFEKMRRGMQEGVDEIKQEYEKKFEDFKSKQVEEAR